MRLRLNQIVRILSLLIVALSFSACISYPIPLALYGNFKGTMHVLPEKIGTKMGKSCYTYFGMGILPLFLIGDGSVKTAADNGGITKVSIVDHETEHFVLGVYGRTCIVVYGE